MLVEGSGNELGVVSAAKMPAESGEAARELGDPKGASNLSLFRRTTKPRLCSFNREYITLCSVSSCRPGFQVGAQLTPAFPTQNSDIELRPDTTARMSKVLLGTDYIINQNQLQSTEYAKSAPRPLHPS